MPRFKLGDRIQLLGDIARFYSCTVGVIVSDGAYPASVLNQYKVRLADGNQGDFFDFQLETPPLSTARLIFDTLVTPNRAGQRGLSPGRHLHLAARDIDIHLKVTGATSKTILGQATAGTVGLKNALVSLFVKDEPAGTTSTDDSGEFTLRDVPARDATIEILLPNRRVLASLELL